MVNKSKNYYEILGVGRNASLEDIRSRYKFLVQIFHPDRLHGSDLQANAENELKQINEAYSVLSNQNLRKEYDSTLIQNEDIEGEGEEQEEAQNSDEIKRSEAVLSYIDKIMKRWKDQWDRIPSDDELDKLIKGIRWKSDQIIFGNEFIWRTEDNEQKEIVEKLLFFTIVACLSLGIEKRENGLATSFSENEILSVLSLSFIGVLTQMASVSVRKSLITKSEAVYHLDKLQNLVVNVCLLSFHLLSRKVEINASSPRKTNTQPQTNGHGQQKPNIKTMPVVERKNESVLGTFFTFLAIITILGFCVVISIPSFTKKSSNPTSTPRRMVVNSPTTPVKRKTATPYPTRTRPAPTPTYSCKKWNTVKTSDRGKTLCVYGDVRKSYFAGNDFHVAFGTKDSDFRFIIANGYYYEGLNGKCVEGQGTVQVFKSLPYITVDDLYKCP